jgi:hypothetical protein
MPPWLNAVDVKIEPVFSGPAVLLDRARRQSRCRRGRTTTL